MMNLLNPFVRLVSLLGCLWIVQDVCAQPLRIVFLAGNPSHGYGSHEHLAGSRILAEAIENATDNIRCEVYGGGWPEDESVLEGADAIVMYCDGGGRHPALQHLDTLSKHMQRGAGFACLHYAVEVPKDSGGREFLDWLGGYFEIHWSVNPHWTANFTSLPKHPATRGVQPFEANDEWYFHMRFQPEMKGVTPLLTAVPPAETMRRPDGAHSGNPAVRKEVAQGIPQHVAWIYERPGGGRSFGFTGGHYHWNWGHEDVLRLVSNSIVWIAGGDVPEGGLAVTRPTLQKLEKGQDEPVPDRYRSEETRERFKLTSEVDPADPRAPQNAVAGLTVHPELEVTLTASEPDLLSLTNLDIDHRGRIWVCEVVNYRSHNGERPEGDRILILEDTNTDGKIDTSKVFYQGRDIDSAMGICVLDNKVIVSASPNIWVFTDEDRDDKPDRKELFFSNTGQPQHDHSAHSFLFGPDGKLYWNFGNTGKAVHDAAGKIVVDKAGNEVRDDGDPYYGGMPFRCNLDGSEFEVLAHNFRNNYEVTVDSFGALWQSDNDDDGNRATRINYVMEFGNYGYRDELTGAGWREPRTNLESTIPEQHWHLNDPGVVPTMLLTGAGSPTGITVYEGDLLPEVFHNQVLHCDAGPNAVRAYPTTVDGAGYRAQTENLLVGERDRWFRPADVCVAPDGSVFVTDWYDPGVGGHAMGDTTRGRLFRIAPAGSKYAIAQFDFATPAGAVAALRNPNQSVRYLAWRAIQAMGEKARGELERMATDENPRMRSRALWALGKLPEGGNLAVAFALSDEDPDLRMVGIRLARQLGMEASQYIGRVLGDSSPQVRRELAIALRHDRSEHMPTLWAALAMQHDGQDRWYLEALGIGAELRWQECFAEYLKKAGDELNTPAAQDIIWRARAPEAAQHVARLLTELDLSRPNALRMLRALDFHQPSDRAAALTAVVERLSQGPNSNQNQADWIVVEALLKQPRSNIQQRPKLASAVERYLARTDDPQQQLRVIEHLGVKNSVGRLVALAMDGDVNSTSVRACESLLRRDASGPLLELLHSEQLQVAVRAARVLAECAPALSNQLLMSTLGDPDIAPEARVVAAKGLASKSDAGAKQILEVARNGRLPSEARYVVGSILRSSQNAEIRRLAKELFPAPKTRSKKDLPPLAKLIERRGNAAVGEKVFKTTGTCAKCHVLNNQGKNVGPDLSEIGSKLTKEALYVSILDPSAGISHNFESYAALLDSGQIIVGLMTSQTDSTVTLRDAQAIDRRLDRSEIEQLTKQKQSLMPANLAESLSTDDLVHLVEYLLTLKKAP